jgi:hypothetical protein
LKLAGMLAGNVLQLNERSFVSCWGKKKRDAFMCTPLSFTTNFIN